MQFNKNKFNFQSPLIMGVCNLTKDSFSDGGKNYRSSDALKSIKKMWQQGASIIDIGAESARPGSDPITYKKEIKKLEPILNKIPKNKFMISIDTYKTETQEFVLQRGAHIINDIYGGNKDLFFLSKKYKSGLILMHTPGTPKTMQSMTNSYKDILKDIRKIFIDKTKELKKYKIPQSKVWFDPGIGFGKNLNQNLTILKNIQKFKIDNYGLLLGSSRKSWINKIDKSHINQRLGGSIASVLYCLEKGVDVFRVHDVQETNQAINIYKKIICSK